ncbi:MAG: hypothetical protein P4M13_04165 [Alphaproteobacteria bacterium]|nr:hypothetical protein [Alphaproteobacteria bacterium]
MARAIRTRRGTKAGAYASALVLSLVFLCVSPMARADDPAIKIDQGSWKPPEHVMEGFDQKALSAPLDKAIKTENEAVATPPVFTAHAYNAPTLIDPNSWKSPQQYQEEAALKARAALQTQSAAEQGKTAITKSTPAASVLSVNPPVLPGVNDGFSMRADSTGGGHAETSLFSEESQARPDFHLSDANWRSPAAETDALIGNEGGAPLPIRMTFLPAKSLAPVPEPEHESPQKLARLERKKTATFPAVKSKAAETSAETVADKGASARTPTKLAPHKTETPAEAAACAAIDAYKKQQLAAIQGDQQTLKALQVAIHSLGLDKKLNFATNRNGDLDLVGGQTLTSAAAPAQISAR